MTSSIRGLAQLEAEERDRSANFAGKAVAAGLQAEVNQIMRERGNLLGLFVAAVLQDKRMGSDRSHRHAGADADGRRTCQAESSLLSKPAVVRNGLCTQGEVDGAGGGSSRPARSGESMRLLLVVVALALCAGCGPQTAATRPAAATEATRPATTTSSSVSATEPAPETTPTSTSTTTPPSSTRERTAKRSARVSPKQQSENRRKQNAAKPAREGTTDTPTTTPTSSDALLPVPELSSARSSGQLRTNGVVNESNCVIADNGATRCTHHHTYSGNAKTTTTTPTHRPGTSDSDDRDDSDN
jgi:hypothetical protein